MTTNSSSSYSATLHNIFTLVDTMYIDAGNRFASNENAKTRLINATKTMEKLIKSFKEQVDGYSKSKKIDKRMLKEQIGEDYLGELLRMKRILVQGAMKNYVNSSMKKPLKSLTEPMIIYIFGRLHQTILDKAPTALYHAFCKGITYFDEENGSELGWPYYHRERSCGPRNLTLTQKYELIRNNARRQWKEIRINMCYLDRKIYNEIYKTCLFKQNTEHLHEFKDTERLYQDYYPGKSIDVQIGFNRDIYPIELNITYHDSRAGETVIERYTRQIITHVPLTYSTVILCHKQVRRANTNVQFYKKAQTESREEQWTRM